MKLENMVVAVTGAGRGIGRALAVGLAREGAKVVVCSRSSKELAETARLASKAAPQGKQSILYMKVDITKEQDCALWAKAIKDQFGKLDALVNNAGVLGKLAPISEYPYPVFKDVINVNVIGTYCVTKAVLSGLMLEQKSGTIINISSGVAKKGRALWGAYSISKFATEGFNQILALELADKGVKVFALNPGGTRTDMRAEACPQEDPNKVKGPEALVGPIVKLITEGKIEDTGKSYELGEI
ncbi:SDR family NAD(P)-dependent oxidoreductase [Elusimicrobiota bacterium]